MKYHEVAVFVANDDIMHVDLLTRWRCTHQQVFGSACFWISFKLREVLMISVILGYEDRNKGNGDGQVD